MNLLCLYLNFLRRDWRVLLIALVLAVGSSIGGCAALIHPTATAFSGEGSVGFVGWISAAHPPTYL
jgi:hypothetical protein